MIRPPRRREVGIRGGVRGILFLSAWFFIAGCDPSFAVVAVNSSADPMLIGRIGVADSGDSILDVVESPLDSNIRLGSLHVDSWLKRIIVMSQTCEILADMTLSEAFNEGGSVLIKSRDDIEFQPGGNPGGDQLPSASTRCIDVLKGLPATSSRMIHVGKI